MMRKDVKLGFAIGGVLLAVVVVYVLVGTGGGDEQRQRSNTDATIVSEDTSARPSVTAGSGSPNTPTHSAAPVHQDNASGTQTARGTTAAPATELASAAGTPDRTAPAGGTRTAEANPTTPADPTPAPGSNDGNGNAWNKVLNEGMLMSATPTPPGGVSVRSNSGNPGTTPQGDNTSSTGSIPPAAATDDPRAQTTDALSAFGPATQPNDATPTQSASADTSSTASRTSGASHSTGLVSRATTHVVQKGETLAQISQAAYGSPNFWPAIQRANPSLDPKKLHPGMTVNLPSIDEVKPQKESTPTVGSPASAGMSSSNRTAPSIDPRTQYVVAQNDSLYQISMKLYGKPTMIDKIYEANKETIGPDRAKLKLNMVLKLPEPPTQTASR